MNIHFSTIMHVKTDKLAIVSVLLRCIARTLVLASLVSSVKADEANTFDQNHKNDLRYSNTESPWRINASLGNYTSTISQADVVAITGQSASDLVAFENSSSGYAIGVGYHFNNMMFVEAGYLDQGQLDNNWASTVRDVDAFISAVEGSLPVLSSGTYVKAGMQADIGQWRAKVYLGLHMGNQEVVSVSKVNDILTGIVIDKKEDARFIGVGIGYALNDEWHLGLQVESFMREKGNVNAASMGVTYQF